MTDSTKVLIATTALNEMFRGNYFSVCTVNEVAKMLNVTPNARAMEMLNPLHCIHWSAMPQELLDRIPGLIQNALGGPEKFQFEAKLPGEAAVVVVESPPPPPHPSWVQKMFSSIKG